MTQFFYFSPCENGIVTKEQLLRIGLGYALDRTDQKMPQVDNRRTASGPNRKAGVLFTVGQGTAPPGYFPDSQTWIQAPDYWVGLPNDGPRPGPSDLQRERVVAGEVITLSDGADWTVPICFSLMRGTTLPKSAVLGPDGQSWRLEALPEFLKLCRDAEKVWDAFAHIEDGMIRLEVNEVMPIACEALAVNYRVSKYEISLLRLLDTAKIWDIMKAIIDLNSIERIHADMEKKSSASA